MLQTVNHTGVTVADVDVALAFYRDVLGMAVDESRSGRWSGAFLSALTGHEGCSLRIAMVTTADGSRIQLEQFYVPEDEPTGQSWTAPGGGHICIEVEDIFEVAERVRGAGYEILSRPPEPVPLPEESVNAGGYMMGVRDPDGHVLELLQTPER